MLDQLVAEEAVMGVCFGVLDVFDPLEGWSRRYDGGGLWADVHML